MTYRSIESYAIIGFVMMVAAALFSQFLGSEYFFGGHQSDLVSYDGILDLAQAIFHIPLALLIYACFFGRISGRAFFVLALSATVVNHFGLIDDVLHGMFADMGVYRLIISNQSVDAGGFVNPQYAKIVMYGLFMSILIVEVLIKKTRTLDRVGVLFVTMFILASLFVAHKSTAQGNLKDVSIINSQVMRSSASLDDGNFESSCQSMNYSCYQLPIENDFKLHDERIRKIVNDIRLHAIENNIRSMSSGFSVPFVSGTTIRVAQFFFKKHEDEYRVIIDENYNSYRDDNAIFFSAWLIFAHAVWLLVGFYLIQRHKRQIGAPGTSFSKNKSLSKAKFLALPFIAVASFAAAVFYYPPGSESTAFYLLSFYAQCTAVAFLVFIVTGRVSRRLAALFSFGAIAASLVIVGLAGPQGLFMSSGYELNIFQLALPWVLLISGIYVIYVRKRANKLKPFFAAMFVVGGLGFLLIQNFTYKAPLLTLVAYEESISASIRAVSPDMTEYYCGQLGVDCQALLEGEASAYRDDRPITASIRSHAFRYAITSALFLSMFVFFVFGLSCAHFGYAVFSSRQLRV